MVASTPNSKRLGWPLLNGMRRREQPSTPMGKQEQSLGVPRMKSALRREERSRPQTVCAALLGASDCHGSAGSERAGTVSLPTEKTPEYQAVRVALPHALVEAGGGSCFFPGTGPLRHRATGAPRPGAPTDQHTPKARSGARRPELPGPSAPGHAQAEQLSGQLFP